MTMKKAKKAKKGLKKATKLEAQKPLIAKNLDAASPKL